MVESTLDPFTKKSSFVISLLFILMLFFPKINVLSFEGRETAGIRVDDLALFLLCFPVFFAHITTRRSFHSFEKITYGIVLFSLGSFFLNRLFLAFGFIHVEANILYVLRLFEYFIYFYVGLFAARHFPLSRIIWFLLAANGVAIVLQKLGIMGQFTNYGYEAENSHRSAGLCSFPSEMGLVLNIFFGYLLFSFYEEKKKVLRFFSGHPFSYQWFTALYPFVLFIFVGALVVITGSRIALAMHGFLFFIYLLRSFHLPTLLIAAILFFSGTLFVVQKKGVDLFVITERMQNLFRKENLELITDVWKEVDIHLDPTENAAVWYDEETQDESWWMRIHKWAYALKIYLHHPESYLQGIGPGFATAALDGGVLRIVIEYGVIGFCLFTLLFRRIAALSFPMKMVVLSLLVNMLFFDAYLAYKPMALIFFLTGYLIPIPINKVSNSQDLSAIF